MLRKKSEETQIFKIRQRYMTYSLVCELWAAGLNMLNWQLK